MDNCNDIIAHDGEISPLNLDWIEGEIQKEYAQLLNNFIGNASSAS